MHRRRVRTHIHFILYDLTLRITRNSRPSARIVNPKAATNVAMSSLYVEFTAHVSKHKVCEAVCEAVGHHFTVYGFTLAYATTRTTTRTTCRVDCGKTHASAAAPPTRSPHQPPLLRLPWTPSTRSPPPLSLSGTFPLGTASAISLLR